MSDLQLTSMIDGEFVLLIKDLLYLAGIDELMLSSVVFALLKDIAHIDPDVPPCWWHTSVLLNDVEHPFLDSIEEYDVLDYLEPLTMETIQLLKAEVHKDSVILVVFV